MQRRNPGATAALLQKANSQLRGEKIEKPEDELNVSAQCSSSMLFSLTYTMTIRHYKVLFILYKVWLHCYMYYSYTIGQHLYLKSTCALHILFLMCYTTFKNCQTAFFTVIELLLIFLISSHNWQVVSDYFL